MNKRQPYNKLSYGASDKVRILIVLAVFGVALVVFAAKLVVLQIADNKYYAKLAEPKNYSDNTIETCRGEVYDRNGIPLITNRKTYNVRINKSTLGSEQSNDTILKFIRLCEKNGIKLEDSLPVSVKFPYELNKDYIFDDKAVSKLNRFIKNNELDESDIYGKGLYKELCKKYGIDEKDEAKFDIRKLLGIRYDMEVNDFSYLTPYTVLYDVDEKFRTVLSEHLHELHGIEISYTNSRYYDQKTLGSHFLGRTGPIFAEEADEYVKQKGYSYNAVIGKDGIEKAFENYLRGIDGVERIERDDNNNVIGKTIVTQPKPGYSVHLTIDSGMQKVAEDALEQQIAAANAGGASDSIPHNGEDCRAGSVAVMNPNNGEVLALASSPNYDLNTFSKDYDKLFKDPGKPLINRATQGIYPPGSTFKIATAAAALSSGVITTDTTIYDAGAYTKYDTYQPHCWIYDKYGTTHGYLNVKTAIEVSCNYFFYKVSDEMGIDTLTKYASLFGLGKETGIEVPESTGILASPEYRESIGLVWNPGDTLQAGIGQSDNAFTPIQLCSYMSAVVNGGTRYRATLLKSVNNYYTGSPIFTNTADILNKIDISNENVEVLKSAMRQVVVEGTAKNVFDGYPFAIGGKTGTAQVTNGSDTALFVGFAPYDDPQIVVSVVVENAYYSSRAANVAKSVFDYYFRSVGLLNDENTPDGDETNGTENIQHPVTSGETASQMQ